ncbi:MAG: dephospho-CoA kinase [Kiritimatiellia bacterium]
MMSGFLRYVLTGGIASGKSLAAEMFRGRGWRVLDADDVVHGLEGREGAAVEPIRAAFGDGVLAGDGSVDRRALGARVFGNVEDRRRLEGIVHPLVRGRFAAWFEAGGGARSLAVVPLLFECGWESDFDVVVCVASEPVAQVARLMAYRGLTEQEAWARVNAQLPLEEKVARSDYVIPNHGSAEAFEQEVRALLGRIEKKDR